MNSVVSLRTFTNASNVPIILFVDMQQEYVAAPRPLAISGGDGALMNCRTGLPVPSHRHHKVTCRCDVSLRHGLEEVSAGEIHRAASRISRFYADVHEMDDWIAPTLPRKLGIGNNAGG